MERQTIAVNPHDEINENESTAVIAVCSSLLSLPVIYAAVRTVIWMPHPSWTARLLTPIFIVMPVAVAFLILYFGYWHSEWQRPKRILWATLSSCLIYVADIFLTAWIAVIGICVLQFFTGF